MSIYVDLRDKVYDSVAPMFPNNELIQAYDNGPEVTTPYITFDIISSDQIGREYISTFATDDQQQMYSHYEVRLRLEFIGKQDSESNFAAAEMANEFYFLVDQTPIQETFLKNSLSLFRKDSLKRVPKKRETDWYMCYQVDLILGYQVETRQTVDIISTVEIESVFTKPNNQDPIIITQTI